MHWYMATSYVPIYQYNVCVGKKTLEGERSWITQNRTTIPPPPKFISTQMMTVSVGEAIIGDGVQQITNDLERRLKSITKERNKLTQMQENTKRAFTHVSKFSSKLGGVTHKTIKLSLINVELDLRCSTVTTINFIVISTWFKFKSLPLNWEVLNTRQELP